MDKVKYWLWLHTRNNLTPIKANALLTHFKTPENIYNAERYDNIDGIKLDRRAVLSLEDKHFDGVDKIMNYCLKNGVAIITRDDEDFPESLRHIYNPPLLLFALGDISCLNKKLVISFVGTRSCSAYGIRIADKLAGEIAKYGVVVVSGMAKGIDSAAHEATIRAGGKTVAVLGSGIDVCYPKINKKLMNQIAKTGAVITEFVPGTAPERENFPFRNRIISGLARGVVITEAPERSGALITASYAADQGKDVFAVPGDITNPCSVGTNRLIADGAKLITCVDDILVEYIDDFTGMDLERQIETNETSSAIEDLIEDYTEDEKAILRAIGTGEVHIDKIIHDSGLDSAYVISMLTMFEITGITEQMPGKIFKLII
ncbi:MAG: DNA-processing protein DprA [Clostridia bacterium]|nr:DNA-processing protein DprA [Clostridia bacterium]